MLEGSREVISCDITWCLVSQHMSHSIITLLTSHIAAHSLTHTLSFTHPLIPHTCSLLLLSYLQFPPSHKHLSDKTLIRPPIMPRAVSPCLTMSPTAWYLFTWHCHTSLTSWALSRVPGIQAHILEYYGNHSSRDGLCQYLVYHLNYAHFRLFSWYVNWLVWWALWWLPRHLHCHATGVHNGSGSEIRLCKVKHSPVPIIIRLAHSSSISCWVTGIIALSTALSHWLSTLLLSTLDIWTFYLKNWNINNVLVWYHTGFLLVTTLSPFNDHCPLEIHQQLSLPVVTESWWLGSQTVTWKWVLNMTF